MLCYLHFYSWTPAMWIKKEKHRQELSVLVYSAHDSAQTFVNNTFYLTNMQNAELYCAVNTVFF